MRFLLAILLSLSIQAHAKRVLVAEDKVKELPTDSAIPTGREEASKYFSKGQRSPAQSSGGGSRDHYLGLHAGAFISSESYVWGQKARAEDNGKLTLGVTYRMGEWVNAADFLLRADFISYEVDTYKPLKLSILFAAAFPDANSRFPLYFGGGIGPGVFFKQVKSESPLSIDYQLFAGARFFDVFESIGFFGEAGIKNHFHLLSDGQFNSVYFALGTVFTF